MFQKAKLMGVCLDKRGSVEGWKVLHKYADVETGGSVTRGRVRKLLLLYYESTSG